MPSVETSWAPDSVRSRFLIAPGRAAPCSHYRTGATPPRGAGDICLPRDTREARDGRGGPDQLRNSIPRLPGIISRGCPPAVAGRSVFRVFGQRTTSTVGMWAERSRLCSSQVVGGSGPVNNLCVTLNASVRAGRCRGKRCATTASDRMVGRASGPPLRFGQFVGAPFAAPEWREKEGSSRRSGRRKQRPYRTRACFPDGAHPVFKVATLQNSAGQKNTRRELHEPISPRPLPTRAAAGRHGWPPAPRQSRGRPRPRGVQTAGVRKSVT